MTAPPPTDAVPADPPPPLATGFAAWCRLRAEPGTGDLAAAAGAALAEASARGHVCIHAGDLPCPDGDPAGPLLRTGLVSTEDDAAGGGASPLVLAPDGRLYLARLWRAERRLARALLERSRAASASFPPEELHAALDGVFGPADPGVEDRQRLAAALAAVRPLAVVSGGPGTGKTRTLALILALLARLGQTRPRSVALAAPTARAAARMEESVRRELSARPDGADALALVDWPARTLHRLLEVGTRSPLPRRDAEDPLGHDLVVVDEASMMPLILADRLCDALRPETRLLLLGDRDQLASVEAGNVLADVCDGLDGLRPPLADLLARAAGFPVPSRPDGGDCVVGLTRVFRFAEGSGIAALAAALRDGDGEAAAALAGRPSPGDLRIAPPGELDAVLDAFADAHAEPVVERARAGDADGALSRLGGHRLLAPTRHGRHGVAGLNAEVERRLRARGLAALGDGYVGRPVMVARNDYGVGLMNGDAGVLLGSADGGDRVEACFPSPAGPRRVSADRLPAHETMWAATVHKSQGSEYDEVTVVLADGTPDELCTRELLYTAATRARKRLTVVASVETLRRAAATRSRRSTGLARRLRFGDPDR